jgi:hypothetical protein
VPSVAVADGSFGSSGHPANITTNGISRRIPRC